MGEVYTLGAHEGPYDWRRGDPREYPKVCHLLSHVPAIQRMRKLLFSAGMWVTRGVTHRFQDLGTYRIL